MAVTGPLKNRYNTVTDRYWTVTDRYRRYRLFQILLARLHFVVLELTKKTKSACQTTIDVQINGPFVYFPFLCQKQTVTPKGCRPTVIRNPPQKVVSKACEKANIQLEVDLGCH